MKHLLAKSLVLVLVLALMVVLAVGCGNNEEDEATPDPTPEVTDNVTEDPPADDTTEDPTPDPVGWERPDNHITVEIFGLAGIAGIGEQGGWFGQMIYDQFNMTINQISAPDGNNQLLWDTRLMAGNLGDIILVNPTDLDDIRSLGQILDITDFVDGGMMPYYTSQFPAGLARSRNLGGGRIYGLATAVSTQELGAAYVDGHEISRSPFLRQDKYFSIGAPVINTLEDLPGVLAQMRDAYPLTETGNTVYGFTMWGNWCVDDIFLANIMWFDRMYGQQNTWQLAGMLDPVNQTYHHIFEEDGFYKRALRMFFEANQLGLVNPDSPTQTDEIWGQADDGQILFSWYSWFGAGINNEEANVEAGRGMSFIPIMDQTMLITSILPDGRGRDLIGIGSQTPDPERLVAFLDWMASPDIFQAVHAGPEGLTWEMVGGEPVLTAFGLEAGMHTQAPTEANVPAEWGGGNFEQGSWRNPSMILRHRGFEINPNTGFTYDPRHWPSLGAAIATPLQSAWQAHFNATSQAEWLDRNNMLVAAPVHGVDFVVPDIQGTPLDLIHTSIRSVTRPAMWQMIFAADEAEFDSIWEDMMTQIEGLGLQELIDNDRALAEEYFALVNAYFAAAN